MPWTQLVTLDLASCTASCQFQIRETETGLTLGFLLWDLSSVQPWLCLYSHFSKILKLNFHTSINTIYKNDQNKEYFLTSFWSFWFFKFIYWCWLLFQLESQNPLPVPSSIFCSWILFMVWIILSHYWGSVLRVSWIFYFKK